MFNPQSASDNVASVISFTFLDSPSTTSATTYAVDIHAHSNRVFYVNRSGGNEGQAASRTMSTITLMEIAG